MMKIIRNTIYSIVLALAALSFGIQNASAQQSSMVVTGQIIESGTGLPLNRVSVSVTTTGELASSNEAGSFSITVPGPQTELIFNLPGYKMRKVFTNGRSKLNVTLVPSAFKSFDDAYNQPLGSSVLKDETYAVSPVSASEMALTKTTSFDQALQGLVPGLHIVEQSGLPGQKTWINIRGIGSLVGRNEPLLMIDGMIHDYNYAHQGLMEGYELNPMDIVDVDDIADITILKNGDSYMGATSSNGLIYLNTEQKSETSTLIKISASAGVTFVPKQLDVLNAGQFKDYFVNYLGNNGYTQGQMEREYPWLIGSGNDKFKYANSTDWQKQIYKPGILQKYHIFLKGGDDIATYNISAGFLNHDGALVGTSYNRFNLRVNGKVNISEKFSITPNVKLSLADTYTPNLGPTVQRNPVVSAMLKPSIMAPYARDIKTGEHLPYLDDDGMFQVSNPVSLVEKATGTNRNYHFLSSVNAQYKFSEKLIISTLLGINFNNARENIFIPSTGVVQIDSAANSPMDFVYEFRSTQSHTMLSYNTQTSDGRTISLNTGMRYVQNSYKHNIAIDLNTPSDDFKNLGQGSRYNYLRQSLGDNRDLTWISYFANANYSVHNRYFFNANLSVDASSALNTKNRYNVYPSVGAAWRLSSEEFLAGNENIEDLKLRASYSLAGNIYSSIYDYSKLYYGERRMNNIAVVTRESIPNEDLKVEKTNMLNLGLDFSGKQQLTNAHIDVYYSLVNNLIIEQKLPPGYGFTYFYDNGGQLSNLGFELALDHRKHFGDFIWTIGATAATNISMVGQLNFIDDDQQFIINAIEGAEIVTMEGKAVNAFYGYKTNGIFASNEEANKLTGPLGRPMQAGDIRFVDQNNDQKINELDKTIIGNPNPFLFGGINTALEYGQWSFKALFTYSVGNDIYNYVRYKGESMDTYANQFTSVLDRWSSSNTGASMPRTSFGDPTGNTVFSDRWMEDGSFLKLKQLTVSYTLPESGLYRGINLYLTMSNLLTLTRYSGQDPEFYYMNNPFYMGVDYGKLPHSPSFIIGVKLDL
ncbi:MAG: SusC/RagA family TonB-linked outer membrane protein [Prolixibacteraceae bacterium]|nr:SusC/RagA family TonB-linked outer membrane protein [Prolixibacteraceae bacterium]